MRAPRSLKELLDEVTSIETPSREEERRILEVADKILAKIREEAEKEDLDAEVNVEGSLAKGTWLKSDPEIDIFIQLPPSFPKEGFGKTIMQIAKKVTEGSRSLERYAEHPYLESYVEDYRVNIVPCYKVERGRWMSATDRTPYHTEYVKAHLDGSIRMDMRLLKRFMRGIGAYGAEIRTGGFSGYLCELLIIHYGSFLETMKAASKWRATEILDIEGQYSNVNEALEIFGGGLIVIDPVDEARNVAAGVRDDKRSTFIVASREFLKSPRKAFFYPSRTEAYDFSVLKCVMEGRGSQIIFIKFMRKGLVPDVLWGQLFKTGRVISETMKRYGFHPLKRDFWSDNRYHIILIEAEYGSLPEIQRHLGPPIYKKGDSSKFIKKHLGSDSTLSGPSIEGDRWVVYKRRKYRDVVDLLTEKLKDGGRDIGVPNVLAEAIESTLEILVNMEISSFYESNSDFSEFLTDYLRGRPKWLE